MPQTSYSINIPAVAYPGQWADGSNFRDHISAAAFAAALNYGVLVVSDTTNGTTFEFLAARVPAASADVTTIGLQLGVVLADQSRPQNPAVATPQYPQFAEVSIARQGRIWVNAETAMADSANPFIRFASGAGGTVLGSFRNSADTATAIQMASTQAVMRGTTLAAGYAVVELDLL